MNRKTIKRYSVDVMTGSVNPYDVTHAISIKLMYVIYMLRAGRDMKIVENCDWIIPPGWYGVHASQTLSEQKEIEKITHILNTIEKRKNKNNDSHKTYSWYDIVKQFHQHRYLRDMIVGLIHVGEWKEKHECGTCLWSFGKYCHVIRERIKLDEPVFHKGSLGLWEIDHDKREQIRTQEHKKSKKNNLKSLN